VTNTPDAKAETSFERAGDGGVVLLEEEFRQAGRDLEARAVHLASVLERYLDHIERPLVSTLSGTIAQIQEAGLILGETCTAYVERVDRADKQLAHTHGKASAP
jgi:hypothetical protein